MDRFRIALVHGCEVTAESWTVASSRSTSSPSVTAAAALHLVGQHVVEDRIDSPTGVCVLCAQASRYNDNCSGSAGRVEVFQSTTW